MQRTGHRRKKTRTGEFGWHKKVKGTVRKPVRVEADGNTSLRA